MNTTVAVPKRAQVPKMRRQRLASRRPMPIKTAKEATNRMAARVNVGTGTRGKAGAATSVGGMRNIFNQFSWFWKIGERGEQ
jgi:hypothetical protein